MNKRLLIIGTLIAALLQTGVLAKIVTDRAAALQSGQEVLLETGFIDPRDLFRGHYTVLNLNISRVPKDRVDREDEYSHNNDVFAELDTSGEFAIVKKLWHTMPASPTGPVLKGTYRGSSKTHMNVNFPFTRFYAPKDRALALLDMQRERKLGVILSVADDGSAMIKGLTIEGKKIYEEPLF